MTARNTLLTAALAVSVLSACLDQPPAADVAGGADGAEPGTEAPANAPAASAQAALMYRPQPMRAVAEAIRAAQRPAPPARAARSGGTRAHGGAGGS